MTQDGVPDGLAVESVWVVEVRYAPDAASKRPAVRPEHLERVRRLMDDGRLVASGGFLDFSSALLFVRAASEAEAVELVRDDVYLREGVWLDDFTARPFGLVVRREGGAR
jgi:uncharacterized protein